MISIDPNRLVFEVLSDEWHTVYANHSLSAISLGMNQLQLEIVEQSLLEIEQNEKRNLKPTYYAILLARVLDALYPSHLLASSVLAFPLSALHLIKKRWNSLGLPNILDEMTNVDSIATKRCLKWLQNGLLRKMNVYFEFGILNHQKWRVGIVYFI
jgi:hypothetical protein